MTLRHVHDSELTMLRQWRNAEPVRKAMYTQHLITKEEHEAWWSAQKTRQDRVYLIYEVDTTPLGYVSFVDIDKTNKKCTWGLYTSDQAPKGTGYQMCRAAMDYAFGTLQINKLTSEALATNTRAIALYNRLGFETEGHLRSHVWIDGKPQDAILFSILKDEWQEKYQ